MKKPIDRNFDSLVHKFEKRVYNTVKGEWRLKLVKEDLAQLQASDVLKVWDAGCGFAQVSQWLAEAGHQVTLCDLSKKMLHKAEQNFQAADLHAEFLHGAAQDLAPDLPDFDLILFHAVLEWLATPLETLKTVADKVKPGGTLSLLFYNRHAFVYTNVLKGEWRWQFILDDAYIGKGKNLTPPNPQYPHEIFAAMTEWGFEIQTQTGIRVFHDYLTSEVSEKSDSEELFALEYQYCRMPTYRDMGRYIHLVARKT